tara:strand:- start:557 stop:736 length:180 start_codon:yes stop_codon:yes gene_type:complete
VAGQTVVFVIGCEAVADGTGSHEKKHAEGEKETLLTDTVHGSSQILGFDIQDEYTRSRS